jgi:hypothetical protein
VAYPRRVAQLPVPAYSERLTVPWWSWPVGVALAAFFSAEIFLGANPQLNWIPYVILIPGTLYALWKFGSVRIRIDADADDPELRVDDAHLPVAFITEVNILDAEVKRQLLGPLAAPYVFAIQRPWISGAVRVVIDDPDDPTPYWVISTRRPAAMATALVAARDSAATSDR